MSQRKDIHNSEIPELCRACEVRHRGICGTLNPEQLVRLNKVAIRKEYPHNTELLGDMEEVQRHSSVIKGIVKLTKTMADGREQIVGLQFAPDFLGRPFQKESQVSAEAASDVQLCSFPKATIESMMLESTELKQRMLEQTLSELDEAREWMLTLGRKTASEKVASFIHMIARHIHPESEHDDSNTITFDLPLSRADIADFLGLTIETVSRQLTKLRKAGVIEIDHNRHFMVPDLKRLELYSGR